MCVVLYSDHPCAPSAHSATVATFPTWNVETYEHHCDVDSWSKLLIPHTDSPFGVGGGDYICDCPVVYDDETHEPVEHGYHTGECWDRYMIWVTVGATRWCENCYRPEDADCHSGECLVEREMCGRCGLPEHTGSRCDVPCDAGWLVDHPHTWPKKLFAWQYSDEGRQMDDVFDALGNLGCEPPRQPGEPEECHGLGCQRGYCCSCMDAANYWDFCATPGCYYHNCGEPLVRRDGANINENGEIICSGCAEYKVESCITSSRISPN